MKKHHPIKGLPSVPASNPVAKFAHQFNKTLVFSDKRHYQRKAKHSGLEPFLIACA
jgi:hypothetical protein